jgi:hypothetical protein
MIVIDDDFRTRRLLNFVQTDLGYIIYRQVSSIFMLDHRNRSSRRILVALHAPKTKNLAVLYFLHSYMLKKTFYTSRS